MAKASSTSARSDVGTDPEAVVRAFVDALEALDLDAALALCDPAIVYHNKGLPPARGIETVSKQLNGMMRRLDRFEVRMTNLASDGPIVMTERVDAFAIGRWQAEFWVCGTFEVVDGRIVLWRDYFDWLTILGGSLKGLVRMALDRR